MRSKTKISVMLISAILALLLSCSSDTDGTTSRVRLSASAGKTPGARTIFSTRAPDVEEREHIKLKKNLEECVKWNEPNLGAVKILTPDQFIIDFDTVILYVPTDSNDPHKGAQDQVTVFTPQTEDGFLLVPQRINLMSGKNFAKAKLPAKIEKRDWSGLFMRFLPINGVSNGPRGGDNEGFWPGSLIGIRKTDALTPDMFVNAIRDGEEYEWLDKDHIWFEVQGAIPYDTPFHSYICMQHGAEKQEMLPYNPDGYDTWGPIEISGNATCLLSPMSDVISTADYANPEINFCYETKDLLYVYESKEYPGKYILTLNPANPFPIDVEVNEFTSDINIKDERKIQDKSLAVPFQCIKYKREKLWSLSWVHPIADDISGFRIYSSETDSFEDAKVVNELQTGTVWNHHVDDMSKNRNYWITTVFNDGTESNPSECRRRWIYVDENLFP